jgi:hypothetical protein
VFLVDIRKSPAATRSMSYAIRGQRTVDIGKSDVVLSILLKNLGRLFVGLLRTVAVSSEVSARCLILDYFNSWFHRSAFLKNPARAPPAPVDGCGSTSIRRAALIRLAVVDYFHEALTHGNTSAIRLALTRRWSVC